MRVEALLAGDILVEERRRQKEMEVKGAAVDGFDHSDAVCSTSRFALTDIFPVESRGFCVQQFM